LFCIDFGEMFVCDETMASVHMLVGVGVVGWENALLDNAE